MARQYTRRELCVMLHIGVERLVAKGGLENLTTRKVCDAAGLSQPYLYQCYDGIPDLLNNCFLEIDCRVAMLLKDVLCKETFKPTSNMDVEGYCWLLWKTCWSFFMEDGDQTLFYWHFYHSGYYTKEIAEQRIVFYAESIGFARSVVQTYSLQQYADVRMLVANMFNSTLMSAVRVLQGKNEDSDRTMKTVYDAVVSPILRLIETSKDFVLETEKVCSKE